MARCGEVDDTPEADTGPLPSSHLREPETYGHSLCEGCQDVLTDAVLPAAQSPTGEDMAMCTRCQATQEVLCGHHS